MATSLTRAARRLSGSIRGLSDALADAGAASSSSRRLGQRQQPWGLAALRSSATAVANPPPSVDAPASSSSPDSQREEAAPASTSGAATAQADAAEASRPARLPAGHTDFQQRQLVMLFTCTRCNTRAAKAFSKQSYEQGVVIVECPGCQNKHLIADNLGWFGQKGTVEEFAQQRGSTVVRKLADGTVELSPEDLLGLGLVEEATAVVASGGTSSSRDAVSAVAEEAKTSVA
ncbi:hypothetical protein D9Q98_007431 [Chlorella vulgaris]|uniref:DNL-type domain-containing protein n=1 Tax=Chlorella vulgaris TaxID=3077 RepID=A0A9D4YVL3_CHLVU|nr:hypothetical protein D9Q98_007431 [Chlorella vulgaris]